tara:strand:- start:1771 stop:2217 length:447 start_codon:yes stop_codon:yes gene_type:complete
MSDEEDPDPPTTEELKKIDVDVAESDELLKREIDIQSNLRKTGRYGYGDARQLAVIQRRLYGSSKTSPPKTMTKSQTPFEYSKTMERYAPIMPISRSRTYSMEVRGKTNLESSNRFVRNKKRKHRRRKKKKSKVDKDEDKKRGGKKVS